MQDSMRSYLRSIYFCLMHRNLQSIEKDKVHLVCVNHSNILSIQLRYLINKKRREICKQSPFIESISCT